MRKKSTLEPQIIQYLVECRATTIENVVDYLNKKIGVEKKKIRIRIDKMVMQKKLKSIGNVISIRSPQSNRATEQYNEGFEYGPFRVTKKGKVVQIQTNWEKQKYEETLARIDKYLPELRDEIHQKIATIETKIVENFDPLDVLAFISARNMLADPETYTESSFESNLWLLEFVQNLILKNSYEKYRHDSNRDRIPEIENDLKELFDEFLSYMPFEIGAKTYLSEIEKEILVTVMLWKTLVRGQAYPQHIKLIARELYNRIAIEKYVGFSIDKYLETIEEIESQINHNYNEPVKAVREKYQKFLEYFEAEKHKGLSQERILSNYRERGERRDEELQRRIEKFRDVMLKGSFQIEVNEKTGREILDCVSLQFGDNVNWSYPLDASDVSLKPVIRIGETYYCFLVTALLWNIIPILENILTEKDKSKSGYDQKKGEYFENKVLELIGRRLEGAKIYPNLHYTIIEDGISKWPEIDGIIVYGKSLLLIETKAKGKREIVGRKDVLTVTESDLKKSVGEAFSQSKRVYDYINNNETAVFENENRQPALELKRSDFSNIFLINVTSETFEALTTDLNSLKLFKSKLLEGEIYPYVVSIYDLMVITDLLENGDDLIDYLNQRITISRNPKIKAHDELDFFGYYLENGSLDLTKDLKNLQGSLIHGYSEKIDRWYAYERGEVASAEKPTLRRQN